MRLQYAAWKFIAGFPKHARERIGPEQSPGFLQGLITSEAIEARLETIVLIVKHFAQDFPFHPTNAMLCEPQLTCRFILVHYKPYFKFI